MQFRTEVDINKTGIPITHQGKTLMLGSCFAGNMGKKLQELKFSIDLNPSGVIFNPISIAQTLERILEERLYTPEELFFENECWNSFDHHSSFSCTTKEATLEGINKRLKTASGFIKNAENIIITYGTAWIFNHIEKGITVANCHKLPANVFERKLLKIEEIISRYQLLQKKIHDINPTARFIYTVSPVRHLKDGADGNQTSKAILKLAINELLKENRTEYFSAYEIMLDELRDYRFYAEDMVHPSKTAIDYIFEKFASAYFTNETLILNKEISDIVRASSHIPVNPRSAAHIKFCNQTLEKISKLETKHPYLDFTTEKALLANF